MQVRKLQPHPEVLLQPRTWNRSYWDREGLEREQQANISGRSEHRDWQDTRGDVVTRADADRGAASQNAGAQICLNTSGMSAYGPYYLFMGKKRLW